MILKSEIDVAQAYVAKVFPPELLATFEDDTTKHLYLSILSKLVEDTLPEGSTILQTMLAERASFYWVKVHEAEKKQKLRVTPDYRFFVQEHNNNVKMLRDLAEHNLPDMQMKVLAKKIVGVVQRVLHDDPERVERIIAELKDEFTVKVPKREGEKVA
jgi:hypothetical protein